MIRIVRRTFCLAVVIALLAWFVPDCAQADQMNDLIDQYIAHFKAGRYREAERFGRQMVALGEEINQRNPGQHEPFANLFEKLALAINNQGRHAEAESYYRRALEIRSAGFGAESKRAAYSLHILAANLSDQGRYVEAERLAERALAIVQKVAEPDSKDLYFAMDAVAYVYLRHGRYRDAVQLEQRALAIGKKISGLDGELVDYPLLNLGAMYFGSADYPEAEHAWKRALDIGEKRFGPGHPQVAKILNNLGNVYTRTSNYDKAESFHKRALAIRAKVLGPDHIDVDQSLANLASVYAYQGRYADCEALYQRALEFREKFLGPRHIDTGDILKGLASIYDSQERYTEAEPLLRRALSIMETNRGLEHLETADVLQILGHVNCALGRFSEAEAFIKRDMAIRAKFFGRGGIVGIASKDLAELYAAQGRNEDAETMFQKFMKAAERGNKLNAELIESLHGLAVLYLDEGRSAEGLPLMNRAIALADPGRETPAMRFGLFFLRSQLQWRLGQRDEALGDLKQAMQLAETQRRQISGGERERSGTSAKFTQAYEFMVQCEIEAKNIPAAFTAAERGRARSLIEQMGSAHLDLLAGLPSAEAQRLKQAENSALMRLATVEQQLANLPGRIDYKEDERERQRQLLVAALAPARQKVVEAYAAIRSASPAYRQTVGSDFQPVTLESLQKWAVDHRAQLLYYVLGTETSHVFLIDGSVNPVRVEPLTVTNEQAEVLGIAAGPFSLQKAQGALSNSDGNGVVQLVSNQEQSTLAVPKLAALWQVLIPETLREALTDGRVERLIVLPDGPLALLPFETLVVEAGDNPRYLVDVGPPVLYAPSATVLSNLMERPAVRGPADLKPVLTVGNPVYGSGTTAVVAQGTSVFNDLTARSRYSAVGGHLAPLPYSGVESTWVGDGFSKSGTPVGKLLQRDATEANVRFNVAGRRIIHLACHGLTDQKYGNFFGALALTPGPQAASNPADDGMLTLPEIYELNLKSCELAILSACQTNYGPQQKGEGVWALSRGFLVAGARRVVASNWLVDDEAAASLISYYCAGLALDEKEGRPVDYAGRLHAARKWVRSQEKWKSPYYWGTFVLVGPQ